RNNRDAEIRRLYSSYLYLIEDYNGATEQLKMLAYIEPDDPDNLVAIEQTLLMAEKPAEAVKHAQESAQQFPANDIFPTMEGYGLAQLKRYPEAIQSFTRALELVDSTDQSRRSSLITSIGDMTSSAGDTIAALNYYEKAIELDPTNLMAKNNLAYFITLSGGDLDRAEKLSYETIIAKPTSSTELDTYAWILFKQGEYKKAKDYIDRALAFLEDDSADVYEHAGDIYFFNSLPDEALKFWERAGELDPDNKLLHRKIAARTFLYK
ncbi:MAG: tetratricopeptide repeat protein, partial [Muribaculaceae bacterium]|nr:tetratricopeptide repeat protein [Muribaculaceae bacterium]